MPSSRPDHLASSADRWSRTHRRRRCKRTEHAYGVCMARDGELDSVSSCSRSVLVPSRLPARRQLGTTRNFTFLFLDLLPIVLVAAADDDDHLDSARSEPPVVHTLRPDHLRGLAGCEHGMAIHTIIPLCIVLGAGGPAALTASFSTGSGLPSLCRSPSALLALSILARLRGARDGAVADFPYNYTVWVTGHLGGGSSRTGCCRSRPRPDRRRRPARHAERPRLLRDRRERPQAAHFPSLGPIRVARTSSGSTVVSVEGLAAWPAFSALRYFQRPGRQRLGASTPPWSRTSCSAASDLREGTAARYWPASFFSPQLQTTRSAWRIPPGALNIVTGNPARASVLLRTSSTAIPRVWHDAISPCPGALKAVQF